MGSLSASRIDEGLRSSQGASRILLVEDDPADFALLRRHLASDFAPPGRFDLERVETLQAAIDRLAKQDIGVLLLDLHLPDSQSVATVERVREFDRVVPIVVFTAAGDDEIALQALQAGAQDYLVKDELSASLLRRAIRYAMERRRIQDENERLHERLVQLAKLESLGVLAGGIAHDFNNLLTVILANAKLTHRALPPESPHASPLEAIIVSSNVASRLTAQLLAYSGKGRLELAPLDLSAHVREMEPLLRGLLGTNVRLQIRLEEALPMIEADASQIQQIVMNLLINAGEALQKQPGSVEIRTGCSQIGDTKPAGLAAGCRVEPGTYVSLEVRDTGCGMDESTVERIFDPFFSRKFAGRGLGLAATLGIVRGHDGALCVVSRPGEGSTFTAYLPVSRLRPPPPSLERRELRGEGLILVIDDDEAVCEVAQRSLERFGYSVLVASSARQALRILRRRAAEVDLVLLDLTMPDMDGHEAFGEIRRIREDLKIILVSGYDAKDAAGHFPETGLAGFLQKPFGPEELAGKVAEVLHETEAR